MNPDDLFRRYQELQAYVAWTEADAARVHPTAALLEPDLAAVIDDFYAEIERHPEVRAIITGGQEQITRLKGTLRTWIGELLTGPYDRDYVVRRSRVGYRHVEIGLDQVYTNAALSRVRRSLLSFLELRWPGDLRELLRVRQSLNTLLDLDLAIIEDAYQSKYLQRQQRVDRLAAIGQVSGGVAHELRNPLNVVKTSVYYLLNARNPSAEKQAEHLKRIERHVTLADSVITALSNFTRLPLPNVKPVTIITLVREALEVNPVPSSIEVVVDCPESVPPVLADSDQIRIVLGNLIRNAREAMSQIQGARLTISARHEGDMVATTVVDTGVGIPPEQLKQVMEPLYSTKARGLGLGLAIARAILEKHNGRLQVSSAPGQGSTFAVYLPAAQLEG
jgi:two-component system, NtrC family, sensor kinase